MKQKNKVKGKLFLKEIDFEYVFKRKVMKSNNVGKIYLPKELIGQAVFVIAKTKGDG